MTSPVAPGWRLLLALLRILPQGALSRAWGRLAELRLPRRLQGVVNRGFGRIVGVDLEASEHPPEAYASLSDFFVRRLRPGARHWPGDPRVPGSPVDGVLGTFGRIEEGTALQAKGIRYRTAELLGSEEHAHPFVGGHFLTIYLSPRHYHRIHAPVAGRVRRARAIAGRLLPVNLPAVRSVRDLFPANERLVAFLKPGEGRTLALVAIGAYNVGRISAAFDPEWNGPDGRGVTNRRGRPRMEVREYGPGVEVEQGEELMAFHLGSTIVLLVGPGHGEAAPFHPELRSGAELRLGSPLFTEPPG